MPARVYFRVADVVWRVAPDRVLVRHAGIDVRGGRDRGDSESDSAMEGGDGTPSTADLIGVAALVWVALDEPASTAQVVDRLGEEDLVYPHAEIVEVAGQLVRAGWLRASDSDGC